MNKPLTYLLTYLCTCVRPRDRKGGPERYETERVVAKGKERDWGQLPPETEPTTPRHRSREELSTGTGTRVLGHKDGISVVGGGVRSCTVVGKGVTFVPTADVWTGPRSFRGGGYDPRGERRGVEPYRGRGRKRRGGGVRDLSRPTSYGTLSSDRSGNVVPPRNTDPPNTEGIVV